MQLETLYRLDERGRITSTREPAPSRGPRFTLIRSATGVAWAARAGTPPEVVDTLADLVAEEPALGDGDGEPRHAAEYLAAVGGHISSGPAFTFPEPLEIQDRGRLEVIPVEDLDVSGAHFSGWSEEEIPSRVPVLGVIDQGRAVSLCFCARRSHAVAEAGLETAVAYRGRGLAPRVTAAWAASVRSEGLLPIYSTRWTNTASLAVARKLGLDVAAEGWSLLDP